jgi:hypothetical protein
MRTVIYSLAAVSILVASSVEGDTITLRQENNGSYSIVSKAQEDLHTLGYSLIGPTFAPCWDYKSLQIVTASSASAAATL